NIIKGDLVLDCTDNLETRFLINEYCVKNKIPWIYSAAIENHGFVFNVMPGEACFRCIFKEASGLDTCDTAGVLNSISSLIASVQVNEAIKILANKRYEKDMMFFELGKNVFTKMKVSKNTKCLTCKGRYEYLNGDKKKIVKFCGTNTYQIKREFDFDNVKKRLGFKGNYGFCKNMTITKNRVLIKAASEKEAKKIFDKYIGG
ncbi:ThiF family adenylyltransferase, partial [Candidatus Woesearchaeota archaeon]|nr:ThiF family adenylyltransferase [Candidatus Woesearchaeota archaeon]